ncbi:sensor histidine kinase [Nocardioides speluncae]|uniref:sensor histidine kinase n=1 Tax=Nocardioides speluncae TaxID=2670337 RepID=UPI00137A1868|nr:histidine kinase [Nocardioides speluncae]
MMQLLRGSVRELRWALPLALFVGVGSFFANAADDSDGPGGSEPELHALAGTEKAAVVIAVLAALAPALARRAPRTTVVAIGALVATYLLIGGDDGPVYLTPIVASFAVGFYWPVRRWLWWGVLGLALELGGMFSTWGGIDDPGVFAQSLAIIGLNVAAVAIGANLRNRRETRAVRAERAATVEQLRMAQDLHDGVGHGLAVIAMQAGVALHVLEKDPAAARASLEAIRDTSRESLEALRAELSRLRPGTAAAELAPRRGLADLEVLVDRVRAGGLDVRVRNAVGSELPVEVDEAAYVVVQESLTNVLRHADATTAQVGVTDKGGSLVVSVADDGQGGAVSEHSGTDTGGTGGMGISGMRTRVERLGGTLEAGPQLNGARGFAVRATIPLAARVGA